MNEITNETLKDLIERGVAIREQRIAEERARIAAFQEMRARERAERERKIRAILPPPLDELSEIDAGVRHAYIYISKPFPGEGRVCIYAAQKDGEWQLLKYEAENPRGYHLDFQTLEEAVAYAAGVLEI